MNYLLTGASGFLGNIILEKLSTSNNVISLGRSNTNDIQISITEDIPQSQKIDFPVEFVVHAAGLAHEKHKNNISNNNYFNVNFEGTKNLCRWIDSWNKKPKTFIFISSVSVYGVEFGNNITEEHPLNGTTPYALSKIKAEKFLMEWGNSHDVNILILRLPLVVGKNPPGNLGKMVKGIKNRTYLSIAEGKAKKSMVLATDVAKLISNPFNFNGIYNLTDGYHPSFSELETLIAKQLNKPNPKRISLTIAKIIGLIGDKISFVSINSHTINKIVTDLTFSDIKARKVLAWNPSSILNNFNFK